MGQGFWVRDKLMLAVGVAVLGVVGCGSVGVDGGISVEPTNASVRPAVESTVVPDSGEVRERLVSADWTLRSPTPESELFLRFETHGENADIVGIFNNECPVMLFLEWDGMSARRVSRLPGIDLVQVPGGIDPEDLPQQEQLAVDLAIPVGETLEFDLDGDLLTITGDEIITYMFERTQREPEPERPPAQSSTTTPTIDDQ